MSTDAIVIGAGIVGAACAWALSREGLSVRVVEPGPVGGVATAAGMGHIVVIDDPPAEFALTLWSRREWERIAPELPASAEWSRCGTLWIASDAEEMEEARRKLARLRAAGVEAELLDSKKVEEIEPQLRGGLAGGLRVPGDVVVYPPVAAKWVLERAGVVGDRLIRAEAKAISPGVVMLAGGERVSCGLIVNATGLRARELTPGLPLRARKGHLVITDRYPGFCRQQIVELGYIKNAHGGAKESVSFNVQPRPNGQLLIGSSRQFDVEDAGADPRMVAWVSRVAEEFMPGLAGLKVIRCWTGLRAATLDGLPIIGPVPGIDGVCIAAGHEGLGITTSLGTAELVAAWATGRQAAIDPGPYLPGRFAGVGRG
jgi:glycine/D-amino acid oxidase-like deaminating enzyme